VNADVTTVTGTTCLLLRIQSLVSR